MLRTMGALTAMGCATGLAACASGGGSAGSPAASTTLPSGSSTSTTASEASSPTASGLHDIIVATMPALSLHANFPSVRAIDPGSGSVTGSRHFTPPDDSFEFDDWYAVGNGYGLRGIRRLFSRNYDKVAARKSDEGGSGDLDKTVGHIDESGTFHDMTALAPAPGYFEPSTDYMPTRPRRQPLFRTTPQNDDDLKTALCQEGRHFRGERSPDPHAHRNCSRQPRSRAHLSSQSVRARPTPARGASPRRPATIRWPP